MTTIRRSLAILILSSALQSVIAASSSESQDDSSEGPIKIGMSTVLSGPSQYLGTTMSRGIAEAFARVNAEGGIQGRQLELIVMDDAYIPDIAAANSTHLIDNEGVVAIVGNVGTPTAELVVPVTEEKEVVFFGAFTGSSSLRGNDDNDFVFHYRASYEQEMQVIVEHIMTSDISPRRIALLLQASEDGELDGFGRAGLGAVRVALEEVGFNYVNDLISARYVANSLETQSAIFETLDADYSPEAFILVGSYQPSSHFIQYMHRLFPLANFYNLSFAGAGALASSLHSAEVDPTLDFSDRVYMTQVVPPVGRGLADLPADLVEREAHFTAQFFVAALGNIQGQINRQSIKTVMDTMFAHRQAASSQSAAALIRSPANQASDYVVLTRFHNGTWIGVEE